jgi:hypothetical protein
MHITKTAKAVFLLVNHLVAAHTPPKINLPSHRVHDAPNAASLEILKQRDVPNYDAGLGLVPRQEGNGGSCDKRARCKKKNIRNPTDDTKCIRCPPLTKPNLTRTWCERDKDASQEDKKKKYQEKIEEKIKEKFDKFKEKIKERLEKKKETKKKEYEEKDRKRRNNEKKFRRMAVCLPAVAAAIGTTAMLEMADGGFSEDLLDSINMDMLDLWPGSDIDDAFLDSLPNDEKDITSEEYSAGFLEVGDANSKENTKRFIEKRLIENQIDHGAINATSEDTRPIISEKRSIFSLIAQVFRAVATAIGAAAARAASRGGAQIGRATKYFSEGKKPNLKKPGEAKLSRADQKGKAKEVSQNKNWKRCLRGEKAEK